MALTKEGREKLDTTPVAVPLKFKRPLPIAELVRKMVIREVSGKAAQRGAESFDEADDFDVNDDPELKSPYELDEDQINNKFVAEVPEAKKIDGSEKITSTKSTGGGSKPPKKKAPAPAPSEEGDPDTD